MSVRLAACEPCRDAKVACNHERPICGRCRARDQADACLYRMSPFKRRKRRQESESHDDMIVAPQEDPSPRPDLGARQWHHYPNPGFLGPTSHSAIFDHVDSNTTPVNAEDIHGRVTQPNITESVETRDGPSNATNPANMDALHMLDHPTILNLKGLIDTWLGSGVNLPLAGPLVPRCAQAVRCIADKIALLTPCSSGPGSWISAYTKALSRNTATPLNLQRNTTSSDLLAQMSGRNTRWESLGIFFAAACRAALDSSLYPSLYKNERSRRKLINLLTRAVDCCLETCLLLGCMNDLQLILQYENFIIVSQVLGGHSTDYRSGYQTWRKMGELVSSLFALGYHEPSGETTLDVPDFVLELRKSAFCRIYTADKNLSLFLGRPARLTKPHCHLQLPVHLPGVWNHNGENSEYYEADGSAHALSESSDDSPGEIAPSSIMNYVAHTRCAAILASVKEDTIPLFRNTNLTQRSEIASALLAEVDKQYEAFPSQFQLKTTLKDCDLPPFERDFLVGVRLDYLHTRFLLLLVSQSQITGPSNSIVEVAGEMLSYLVELIVLRDKLVNSGTSLIWKVAHFGLPPAGIVSLALLKPTIRDSRTPSRSKMLQDLSVLATEIRIGGVITPDDPDYALVVRATTSIQTLLDKLISGDPGLASLGLNNPAAEQLMPTDAITQWDDWVNADPWDFEMMFWSNLAEHPVLQSEVRGTGL